VRLKFALSGRLDEFVKAEIDGAEIAVTASVRALDRAMRDEIRAPIAAALGPKVAKSWKSNVYPRRGRSASAASYQFDDTSQDWAIRAVTESGPIRARDGKWIALPSPAALDAMPVGFHHSRSRKRFGDGGKFSLKYQKTAVDYIEEKYGELEFVKPRGQKIAYLVAEVRQGKRRFNKARRLKSGKAGIRTQTVIMFFLVPKVRRAAKSSINLDVIADRYIARLAREILNRWPEILK